MSMLQNLLNGIRKPMIVMRRFVDESSADVKVAEKDVKETKQVSEVTTNTEVNEGKKEEQMKPERLRLTGNHLEGYCIPKMKSGFWLKDIDGNYLTIKWADITNDMKKELNKLAVKKYFYEDTAFGMVLRNGCGLFAPQSLFGRSISIDQLEEYSRQREKQEGVYFCPVNVNWLKKGLVVHTFRRGYGTMVLGKIHPKMRLIIKEMDPIKLAGGRDRLIMHGGLHFPKGWTIKYISFAKLKEMKKLLKELGMVLNDGRGFIDKEAAAKANLPDLIKAGLIAKEELMVIEGLKAAFGHEIIIPGDGPKVDGTKTHFTCKELGEVMTYRPMLDSRVMGNKTGSLRFSLVDVAVQNVRRFFNSDPYRSHEDQIRLERLQEITKESKYVMSDVFRFYSWIDKETGERVTSRKIFEGAVLGEMGYNVLDHYTYRNAVAKPHTKAIKDAWFGKWAGYHYTKIDEREMETFSKDHEGVEELVVLKRKWPNVVLKKVTNTFDHEYKVIGANSEAAIKDSDDFDGDCDSALIAKLAPWVKWWITEDQIISMSKPVDNEKEVSMTYAEAAWHHAKLAQGAGEDYWKMACVIGLMDLIDLDLRQQACNDLRAHVEENVNTRTKKGKRQTNIFKHCIKYGVKFVAVMREVKAHKAISKGSIWRICSVMEEMKITAPEQIGPYEHNLMELGAAFESWSDPCLIDHANPDPTIEAERKESFQWALEWSSVEANNNMVEWDGQVSDTYAQGRWTRMKKLVYKADYDKLSDDIDGFYNRGVISEKAYTDMKIKNNANRLQDDIIVLFSLMNAHRIDPDNGERIGIRDPLFGIVMKEILNRK